jgi:hypothetical protein
VGGPSPDNPGTHFRIDHPGNIGRDLDVPLSERAYPVAAKLAGQSKHLTDDILARARVQMWFQGPVKFFLQASRGLRDQRDRPITLPRQPF